MGYDTGVAGHQRSQVFVPLGCRTAHQIPGLRAPRAVAANTSGRIRRACYEPRPTLPFLEGYARVTGKQEVIPRLGLPATHSPRRGQFYFDFSSGWLDPVPISRDQRSAIWRPDCQQFLASAAFRRMYSMARRIRGYFGARSRPPASRSGIPGMIGTRMPMVPAARSENPVISRNIPINQILKLCDYITTNVRSGRT